MVEGTLFRVARSQKVRILPSEQIVEVSQW